jgi:hypothetical protein
MTTAIKRVCAAGYDEGVLKALVDGQVSLEWRDQLREHAGGCAACSERLSQLRMDGALVQGRLQRLSGAGSVNAALMEEIPALPRPPLAAVLARARQREAPAAGWWERASAFLAGLPSLGPVRALPLAGASLGAAALLAVSFTQPAVQSFAQGVVQSLRVNQVQPVKVDPALLRALPVGQIDELSKLGTYRGPTEPRVRATNVADASRSTGLTLRSPSSLPAALKSSQLVYASEAESFSLTYDGQKIAQAAQEYGIKDAALLNELRALNGATVKGTVPAAAVLFYGTPPISEPTAKDAQSPVGKPLAAATKPGAAPLGTAGPFVAFLQMKSPTLEVPPTVNADKLREMVLKSGAVPPQLANQLLAIQDWKSTLPIPVTRGTATQVQVDGVTGTLVTGEAPVPVLIWQANGALYVLGGTLSEAELLSAARSLQPAR